MNVINSLPVYFVTIIIPPLAFVSPAVAYKLQYYDARMHTLILLLLLLINSPSFCLASNHNFVIIAANNFNWFDLH